MYYKNKKINMKPATLQKCGNLEIHGLTILQKGRNFEVKAHLKLGIDYRKHEKIFHSRE